MTWSKEVEKFPDSSMAIDGKIFPTKLGEIDQAALIFYPDNPRVYTTIYSQTSNPSQEDIEGHMCKLSHVKDLRKRIEKHKGLLEPVIVKDGTFEVIEGNSRLAAYRMLKGRAEFQQMRAIVLPADIEDQYVFSYLGNIHINGRTPWAAHEKARYLQRESKSKDLGMLANSIGMNEGAAKKMIKAIEIMEKYGDKVNENFSAYEAMLSSRDAQKAISDFPKLENILVDEIMEGNFDKATEFRAALKPVFTDQRAIKGLLTGRYDLSDAENYVSTKGDHTEAGKRVKTAKQNLSGIERKHLSKITNAQLNKVKLDLKRIQARAATLLKIIDNVKDEDIAPD